MFSSQHLKQEGRRWYRLTSARIAHDSTFPPVCACMWVQQFWAHSTSQWVSKWSDVASMNNKDQPCQELHTRCCARDGGYADKQHIDLFIYSELIQSTCSHRLSRILPRTVLVASLEVAVSLTGAALLISEAWGSWPRQSHRWWCAIWLAAGGLTIIYSTSIRQRFIGHFPCVIVVELETVINFMYTFS